MRPLYPLLARSAPFFAMATNAMTETVRQPVYSLIVLTTLLGYALSPALSMFSFEDDLNLLKDFGVSTVFVSGLLLTAFGASAVLGRELESRAALILLSKPVGRGAFLAAKFAGIVGALALGVCLFTAALLLAARQGPPADIHHPTDWPVIAGGFGAFFLALLIALAGSFWLGRPLGALLVHASVWTFPAGLFLAACFDRGWRLQPFGQGFDFLLVKGALLAFLGVIELCGAAVLISAVFRRGAPLGTILLFLGGLLLSGGAAPISRIFLPVPSLELFWVGELFYERDPVLSWGYLIQAALYTGSYSFACLFLGAWALRRADVG
jgi:hypothetical protein